MARTKKTAPKPTKAAAAKPATAKKTPKRSSSSTPAKKAHLVRDLHQTTTGIEQRAMTLIRSAEQLRGLKGKVDEMSAGVESAKKDHDERVGKVEKDIADYQLQKVQDALARHNKTVIDSFDLQRLRTLQSEREVVEKESAIAVGKTVAEEVAQQVRFKEVEFEKEYVKMQAAEASRMAERHTLEVTIAGLRVEIESQKALSSEIAKANQQMKINRMKREAIEQQQSKDEAYRQAQQQAALMQMRPGGYSQQQQQQPPQQQQAPAPAAAAAPLPPAPTPKRAATPTKKAAGKKSTPAPPSSDDETLSEDSEEGTQAKTPLKRKESSTMKKKAAKKPAPKGS
ncbi:hypothetical protein DIPPA_20154 [Diplonema papillatum]|nr:hypothetical protein DIPPA_20154 [Diplonema papillatum]|eukprot:gene21880-33616_t